MKTQMNLTADCCEKLSLMTCNNGIDDMTISDDMITINSKFVDIVIDYDFIELTQNDGTDDLHLTIRPTSITDDSFVECGNFPYTQKTDHNTQTISILIETDYLLFVLALRDDNEASDLPIISLTVVIK